MTRTATCSAVMHQIDDGTDRRDVRLRQHPMAEVEDVTRPAGGAPQDVTHLAVALRGGSEERRRLEIALNRALTDTDPRRVERDPPVDADHVTTGRCEIFQESRRSRTEVDQRD